MGARPVKVQYLDVHGHTRAFVKVGSGPVLLLLHGLGCDHTTWHPVLRSLSRRYTVIAPDLLGHGRSAKPRADYSVGGYANGMRDLLTILDIESATVVGHSFGGGVAMQFAYQFPERTDRLMLVAPGGLGREVTPMIRAITTPGFQEVMGLLTMPGVRHAGVVLMDLLAHTGLPHTRDLAEVADIYESLRDPAARAAIRHVVRAVVDWRGQIVTMADRAYLTEMLPLCLVWGEDDAVIPVRHADIAAELAPHTRIVKIPDAGHFPHKDHPRIFVRVLDEFMRTTEPSVYDRDRLRELLRSGGRDLAPRPLRAVAG